MREVEILNAWVAHTHTRWELGQEVTEEIEVEGEPLTISWETEDGEFTAKLFPRSLARLVMRGMGVGVPEETLHPILGTLHPPYPSRG